MMMKQKTSKFMRKKLILKARKQKTTNFVKISFKYADN